MVKMDTIKRDGVRMVIIESMSIWHHGTSIIDNKNTHYTEHNWRLIKGTARWLPLNVAVIVLKFKIGEISEDQNFPPLIKEVVND